MIRSIVSRNLLVVKLNLFLAKYWLQVNRFRDTRVIKFTCLHKYVMNKTKFVFFNVYELL